MTSAVPSATQTSTDGPGRTIVRVDDAGIASRRGRAGEDKNAPIWVQRER